MEKNCVYIAPRFFEHELKKELGYLGIPVLRQYGRFFYCEERAVPPVWAQNTWYNPQILEINSIGDACKKLKAIQRNWHSCPIDFFRRAKLIEEGLPKIHFKPHAYGAPCPEANLGAWTLLSPNTLLYSLQTSSPFPHGELNFIENKEEPPSRAYLKLWEIFTLCGYFPKAGEHAIDLGACPGGWTWVMAKHGVNILAIDKAEIVPQVQAMPTVTYENKSGFSLRPQNYPNIDWLLSDMACYPGRLYELTRQWLEKGSVKNFVFTIKLQGEDTKEHIDLFRNIKNSSLLHLSCNKHELTWIYGDIQKSFGKKRKNLDKRIVNN